MTGKLPTSDGEELVRETITPEELAKSGAKANGDEAASAPASGPAESGGHERHRTVLGMFQVIEPLALEVARHDHGLQRMTVVENCIFLVRLSFLGPFVGVLVVSSDFGISYRFRGMKCVALDCCDDVARVFAAENRRSTARRWFLASDTGEIVLAGEFRLYGDPQRDRRRLQKCLLRRIEIMARRLKRIVAREKPGHSEQEQ